MVQAHAGTPGDAFGYLPEFELPCAGTVMAGCDPIQPEWVGQEAVAMPDNWSIGLSFLHNVFVREHNIFVDEFRKVGKRRRTKIPACAIPTGRTIPSATGR